MVKNLTITIPPPLTEQNIMDYTASATPESDISDDDILIKAFSKIPLTALSANTRNQLSRLLNRKKILRSEEGYERDWRGIATLAGQKMLMDESTKSVDDPMEKVLLLWCKNNATTATFNYLQRFLGIIDRWDVSDDISENLARDAKNYTENLREKELISSAQIDPPEIITSTDDVGLSKSDVLTKDDVLRIQQGLPPQNYDAFVLFADADINYAVEIMTRLEDDPAYDFKLCVKDRDLLIGVSFEHLALSQLIEKRCRRLIVIITESFFQSPEIQFLLDYAHFLQIHNKERRILPLIYEPTVVLPTMLRIYTQLRYNASTNNLFDFWVRLADSIRNDSIIKITPSPISNRTNNVSTQSAAATQQTNRKSLTTPPTDIPKISVNGNPLDDIDDVPKKKERNLFKKRSSLRSSSNKQLLGSNNDGALLRSAHSCNQLNSDLLFDKTNLSQMSGLSASTCSGDEKKKKKWSSKLFKKVFSRSSNKLNAV